MLMSMLMLICFECDCSFVGVRLVVVGVGVYVLIFNVVDVGCDCLIDVTVHGVVDDCVFIVDDVVRFSWSVVVTFGVGIDVDVVVF